MRTLNIAVAQFEPKDGDKAYNLSVIAQLTQQAKAKGAQVISFHEMCITAYTFVKDLDREEVVQLAEQVPNGPSVQTLIDIAANQDMHILPD